MRWFGTNTEIDEIKRAREELKTRAEFEQQLVGIVSHDLRNPIAAITMSATTLLRKDDLNEGVRKAANRIVHSADRVTRMIRDLLDFTQSRLGGGIPIERRPLDLATMTRDVIEEIEIAHPDRKITLTPRGDTRGEWDPDRIAQVVGNLVSNAVHHSDPGTPIAVSAFEQGGDVCLEVSNQGKPITPEQLPSLFEPMRRGEHSVSDSSRSLGLGLYIVKQIVLAHSGKVTVRSAPEEGTAFTVRLPRAPPSSSDSKVLNGRAAP